MVLVRFAASLPTQSVESLLFPSVSPLLAGPDSRVNREHQLQLDFLGAALSMITYPLRRRSGSRTSLLSCVFGAATGTGWQAI